MDQILFPPAITSLTFLSLTVVEGLLSGVSLTLNGGLKSTGLTPPGISTLYARSLSTSVTVLPQFRVQISHLLSNRSLHLCHFFRR